MTCSESFEDKPGGRLVEKVNVGRADHIEPDVETFPLAAAERFLHRAADDAVAPFAQTELDQFAFEPAGAIASRKMRRANRGGELQVLADRQMLIERVLLRDVTDVALELIEIGIKRLAVEQNLAAGRLRSGRRALSAACSCPQPLAPITQTSSPRLIANEIPSSADFAVAEAMGDIAHFETCE